MITVGGGTSPAGRSSQPHRAAPPHEIFTGSTGGSSRSPAAPYARINRLYMSILAFVVVRERHLSDAVAGGGRPVPAARRQLVAIPERVLGSGRHRGRRAARPRLTSRIPSSTNRYSSTTSAWSMPLPMSRCTGIARLCASASAFHGWFGRCARHIQVLLLGGDGRPERGAQCGDQARRHPAGSMRIRTGSSRGGRGPPTCRAIRTRPRRCPRHRCRARRCRVRRSG